MEQDSLLHRYLPHRFRAEVNQELDLPIATSGCDRHTHPSDAYGYHPPSSAIHGYYQASKEIYGYCQPSAAMHGYQTCGELRSYDEPYAEEVSVESGESWETLEEIQKANQKYLEILRWSSRVSVDKHEAFEAHSEYYHTKAPIFQEFVQRCPPPPPQREPTWQDYADDQSLYSQHDEGMNGPTGLVWDINSSDSMPEQSDRKVEYSRMNTQHVAPSGADFRKRTLEDRQNFHHTPAYKRVCMEPRIITPAEHQSYFNVAQLFPCRPRFVPDIAHNYWEEVPNQFLQMPSWEQYNRQAKDEVYRACDHNLGDLRWFGHAPEYDHEEPQHLAISPSMPGECESAEEAQRFQLPGGAKAGKQRPPPRWRRFTPFAGTQEGRKTRFHTFAGQPFEIARRRGRCVPHLYLV